jgi:RNAse (barnase) inhibitor barstar
MSEKSPQTERDLVNELKNQLSHQYKNIFSHVRLANNSHFRHSLSQNLGYIPALNEIDLIFEEENGKLRAVEVKLYKIKGKKFNQPFYSGLGQALSLFRYGFDNVALWHLFPEDIDQDKFDRYGAGLWSFIRNDFKLPLEFSYFEVSKKNEFSVMQYKNHSKGFKLISINNSDFKITWKYPNPIFNNSQTQKFRIALKKMLGI